MTLTLVSVFAEMLNYFTL